MSYIGKIERREVDLNSAGLLRTLACTVGPDRFDEFHISGNGFYRYPELREALKPLGVKWGRGRYLTSSSLRRVRKWLNDVREQDIAGLRLRQNRQGWCWIVPAADASEKTDDPR